MIALVVAHLVAYSHYYSMVVGLGCTGWAYRIVRDKP